MTAAPLVLAWAVLLGAGAWLHRPVPVRVARTRRAGRRLPPARARIVRAIVAAAIVAVVALPLAPIVGALVWVAPVLGQRRNERRRQDEVLRALPEVVDLVHLAVGAGLTVPLAVEAVAARASGPLADELRHAVGEVALGRRLADALGDVPARAGEATRPLIAALVESDRYGAPLADSLARLAADTRDDRRRRAEDAARRVPVKLLFPLVCCVLPAFGLLTVAPLLAGSLSALRL